MKRLMTGPIGRSGYSRHADGVRAEQVVGGLGVIAVEHVQEVAVHLGDDVPVAVVLRVGQHVHGPEARLEDVPHAREVEVAAGDDHRLVELEVEFAEGRDVVRDRRRRASGR